MNSELELSTNEFGSEDKKIGWGGDELNSVDDESSLNDDDELGWLDNELNWDDDELGWNGKLDWDGILLNVSFVLLLLCCAVLQKSGLHFVWYPKQCKGPFIQSFCSLEIATGLFW